MGRHRPAMRHLRLVYLAWLAVCPPVGARTVVIGICPERPFQRLVTQLTETLVKDGGVQAGDVLVLTRAGDIAELGDHVHPPEIGAQDSLVVILAGNARLDDQGRAVLAAGDEPLPLNALLPLLASTRAREVFVLAALRGAGDDVSLPDLWPESSTPTALLVGRDERILQAALAGLRQLAADGDADGAVDAGELSALVARRLGLGATRLVARPDRARSIVVSGSRAPDTTGPLVLVTNPRLRDDTPVVVDHVGPLLVQGIVADDRRIRQVTVNGLVASIVPLPDAAIEGLGFPGHTFGFETVIPLAEAGLTEVVVTALDYAGNVTTESFQCLTGGRAVPAQPGEGTTGRFDRLEVAGVEWGAVEDWRYGFRLNLNAETHWFKDRRIRVVANFRVRGGQWLRDHNGGYADNLGRVEASTEFIPRFDHATVRGVPLFVPQRELHLDPGRKYPLEAVVSLVEVRGGRVIATAAPFTFDLTEPTETALIHDFKVEHTPPQNNVAGLLLHLRLTISGFKDRTCQVAVYFQRADGRRMEDRNGRFRAGDGSVAVFEDVIPPYAVAEYRDFTLFLPYDELDLTEAGTFPLRARAVVWDKTGRRSLDASPWAYFTVTRR